MLVSVQPLTWIQHRLAPGEAEVVIPVGRGSLLPKSLGVARRAGHGLPLASNPNGVDGMALGPLQFWKCPISPEKEVL